MASVTYQLLQPFTSFEFCGPDGVTIKVGADGITTDDSRLITELDAQVDRVERVPADPKKGGK